jgi:hypothetical protein
MGSDGTDGANPGTPQVLGNVANGVNPNDAVNMSQLSTVNNRLDQTNVRMGHVGAMAAAIGGLAPLDYDAHNKTMIAASYGNYDGNSAVAVGAYHYINRDLLLGAAMALDSNERMYQAGITVRLGKSTPEPIPVNYNARLADLENKMNDLALENQALKNRPPVVERQVVVEKQAEKKSG